MWRLIFLGFLSLTGTDADPQLRDIFDEAHQLLQQFNTTVNSIVITVSEKLQEAQANVHQLERSILSLSTRIMLQLQEEFLTELRLLERKGEEAGVAVMGCTMAAKRELSERPYALIAQIEQCLTYRVEDSDGLIGDAFSNLEGARNSVQQFYRGIEECQISGDQVCVAILMSQISLQNDLLPAILDSDLQEVLHLLGSIEAYLQECSRTPTDEMRMRGRILVLSATICVDEMLDLN